MRKTTPWHSKVRNRLLTLLFLLAFSPYGWGQALLEENFNYTSGSLLTANGWTAHNSAGSQAITVGTAGLTYSGYYSSGIGLSALVDNTGEDVNKTFTAQTSGTVYVSFLTNVTTIADGYFFHIGPSTIGTNFRGRVFISTDGSNFKFGLSKGSNTATLTSSSYNTGTTYLVVLKYEIVASTANDIVSLFVIPAGTFPLTEPGSASVGPLTDAAISDIDPGCVALRQYSASQNISVDGIRVATTWVEAVKAETTPPTLSSTTPVDDATDIAKNTTLSMTFDENIAKGTGNIVIYQSSDDAELATIDVTTANVSITDATATITLPGNLPFGTECYVQVPATAFTDIVGNAYAGISDKTSWSFTTAAASSAKDVLTFSLPGQAAAATLTDGGATGTITVEMPATADLSALAATFTLSDGASAAIGATPQVSTVTTNDFSSAKVYTVTAEDASTKDWTVSTFSHPDLVADGTLNNVDNNLEITFTDNATWRGAITAVKVDATTLTLTDDYTIAAGVITLIAGSDPSLISSGTKTITVVANGYTDATVSQEILVGAISAAQSSVSINASLALSSTSIVTVRAKDQYNNLIEGYVAKLDVTITDVDATTDELYNVNTVDYTATANDIALSATNVAGVSTFDVAMPNLVDGGDGISIQVQLNNGTTDIGSAFSYDAPLTPDLSASTTLTESTLNGGTIELTVLNETFADGTLDEANFSLTNEPTGVTIDAVTYNSNTSATVTLAYNGTDFDANVTDLNVTVAGAELTGANPLTSNNLNITAIVETAPVVTTDAAITTNGYTTATWGGDITDDGGEAVTEKGLCWNTTGTPTTADSKETDVTVGTVINVEMDGLTVNTLYYVRAYATNSEGTTYGDERSFTTLTPSVSAVAVTEASPYYAGDNITVTWTSDGVTNVKIELYNGTSYSDLVASTDAADGSEEVTIPAASAYGTAYKIRVSDASNATYNAESSAFTVKAVVATLAELIAMPNNSIAKYTGKATVTYTRTSRNQKYIQDETAAVLIDDNTAAPGFITDTYAIGEGISNIEGKVYYYNQLVEFVPLSTTGEKVTGNPVITPEVRTMASITHADQCKLVKIVNYTFDPAGAQYTASNLYVSGKNYDLTGIALASFAFRTAFSESNYIGTSIPTTPITTLCLVGQYNAQLQITPRNSADIQSAVATVSSTVYTVSGADITAVPYAATLATFESNLTAAAGATFETYEADGTTVAGDLATGYKVIVTAEDGITEETYTVTKDAALTGKDFVTYAFGTSTGVLTDPNIAVTVPYTADVENLIATFSVSEGATAKIGTDVQTSGTTANDFTDPVVYTVVAEDGTTKDWTVTVTKEATPSSEKDILTFTVAGVDATVNSGDFTVTATMPYGTDRSALVATFTLSAAASAKVGATVQESGVTANDFTNPVTYIITAEDATTQDWVVTITNETPNTDAYVTSATYTVNDVAGTITNVPYNATLAVFEGNLTPAADATFETYEADGTTVATDLVSGYKVIVTAQDETTIKTYTVTLNDAPEGDLFFSEYLEGSSNNKALEIYNGTGTTIDLTNYTVKLFSNGGTEPSSTLTFTGTLANKEVFVIANSSANATILALADVTSTVTFFNGDDAVGLYNGETLIDVFGTIGSDPGSEWDIAGIDGGSVNHTLVRKSTISEGNTDWVTSAGTNTDDSEWIVYDLDETSYLGSHTSGDEVAPVATFAPVNGTTNVDETTDVTITFDEGVLNAADGSAIANSDLAAKISFFETATPANTVAFDATIVDKVVTVNPTANLKLGIEYTFTLLASSVEDALGNENSASSTSFTIRPAHTDATLTDLKVSGTTIDGFAATTYEYTVTLPYGETETPVVTATVNDSKANAVVTPATDINSMVAADRTTTVTVTAEDETELVYTVLFNVTPALTGKNILTYSFEDQTSPATIGDGTIAVEVTASTNRSALVATFTISDGASIAVGATPQVSDETVNDFTSPVTYVVTAQDGTTKNWVVTVSNAANFNDEADILTFRVGGVDATVDNTGHTVSATLPFGTDRSNLVAEFTLSPGATAKVGETVQVNEVTPNDFTNNVIYTVTAEDGTTIQNWTVSIVNEAPNTDATLSDLKVDGTTVTGFVASTLEYTLNYPYGTTEIPVVTYTLNDVTATAEQTDATEMPGTTTVEVTAQDGTTKAIYTVNFIWDAPSTDAFVTSAVYTVDGTAGTITNIPFNTGLAAFKANLTAAPQATFNVFESDNVTLATSLASGQKVMVTAQDGVTTKMYTITLNEAPTGDLFFSQYIEGGSNNKALEIFNPTPNEVDLSDYVIRINGNGSAWSSKFEFPAGTKLASHDVFVIAHSAATSTILAVTDSVVADPYAGGTSFVVVFNGDDVRGLFKVANGDTTLIDLIGAYDLVDPGTGWSVAGTANATVDHTLIRKSEIVSGNIDWAASAGTDADDSEWVVLAKDDYTNIGDHDFAVVDETSPVAVFNPTNNATGVLITESVTITFDEEVFKATDGSAFTENEDVSSLIEFYETATPANTVAFTATINGEVITVIPSANLTNNVQYTVVLKANVVEDKSANKNELTQASFTTIDAAAPVIELTAPVGGETYYAGDPVNITWNSANIANVKIEAYVPASSVWSVILASTDALDGIEEITIPADAAYGTTYKIRVSDVLNAAVVDSSATFTLIAVATDIAQLRAMPNGAVAKLTGKAVVTFTQSNRNQKFIQDATGAILIDDSGAKITTTYVAGDEMTGLEGSLTEYAGMKEFVPTKDPGAPTANGLTVIPQVIALDEFATNFENYESEIITFEEVKFTEADGTVEFATGKSYGLSTSALSANFYTNFYQADYIGSVIPTTRGTVTGIANSRTTGNYITSRSASDMVFPSNVATLSDLKVDGTTITGFNSNTFDYTIELNDTVTMVPVVTAVATDANALVEVIAATELPGITVVNVLAEDAETMVTYEVRFTYENLSNDATLSNLTVDDVTVEGFNSSVYEYNVVLPYGTTSIPTVAATATFNNAEVLVTQATILPGDAIVMVTAEDEVTMLTYTVHFTVAPNTDATLSNLLIDGTPVEGFSASVTSYLVSVAFDSLPVVSAVATDANATIEYEQIIAVPDTAFVKVTAEDGITLLTYQIIFVDESLGHDASLSNLSVNGTTVTGFDAAVFNYQVVLPYGTVELPVVGAVSSDANAEVTIAQITELPGTSVVTVVAEDAVNTATYEIAFTVAPNTDATLSNLTVDGTTLSGFDAQVFEYTVVLDYGTTTIPAIGATANDANAEVTLTQASVLPGDATVSVLAEDGTTSLTYTVHFTIAANTDATLSDLTVDGTTISGFIASTTEYSIELPHDATIPVVAATATDENADVVINQTTALPGDATIVVTAEDGVSTLTYTLHFTLAAIPTYTVTFNVFDENSEAIENAVVRFNSLTESTNSQGSVVFEGVTPVTDAPFSITKEGGLFETYNGTVTVTDANVTVDVVMLHVGVNDQQWVKSLYPNPTQGKLVLNLNYFDNGSQIKVMDITGKQILGQTIERVVSEIDLTGNKSGVYFIQVISGTQTHIYRIVLN